MAGNTNQGIKLGIGFDEPSGKKTLRLLDDITKAVKGLVTAANEASRALASIGDGGGGMAVSAAGAKPGVAATSPAQTQAAVGRKGGLLGGILGGAGDTRRIAKDTTDSLDSLAKSVKSFANSTVSDADKFVNAVGKMKTASDSMKKMQAGGLDPLNYGDAAGIMRRAMHLGATRSGVPGTQDVGFGNVRPGLPITAPHPSDPVKGFWARQTDPDSLTWFGKGGRRGAQILTEKLGIAETAVGRAAVGIGGVGAAGLAAGYLGYKALDYMGQGWNTDRKAQLDWDLNKPTWDYQRASAVSAPFRQAFSAAASNDVNYFLARKAYLSDPKAIKALSSPEKLKEQVLQELNMTGSIGDLKTKIQARAKSTAGAAWGETLSGGWGSNTVYNRVAGGLGGGALAKGAGFLAGSLYTPVDWGVGALQRLGLVDKSMNESDARNAYDLQYQKRMQEVAAGEAAKYSAGVQGASDMMDPLLKMVRQRTVDRTYSDTDLARRAHLKMGDRIFKDPKGTLRHGDALTVHRAYATGRGLQEDQILNRQATLINTVGTAYAGMAGSLVSAEYGGLNGLPEIMKMGGMLGGSEGAGLGMYKTVQGMTGAGGLSAIVSGQLASGLQSAAWASGGAGTTDLASRMIQSAGGVVGGGATTVLDQAAQERNSALLMEGLGANQAIGNQGVGLYKSMTAMNAMAAAGGYGSASKALQFADPTTLAMWSQARKDSDLPAGAKALGVTVDMVKNFTGAQTKNTPLENIASLAQGARGKELVANLAKAGGDPLEAMRSEAMTEKDPRKRAKLIGKLTEEYGAIVGQSLGRGNIREGEALLKARMLGDDFFGSKLEKKGGVGMGKMGYRQEEVAKGDSSRKLEEAEAATGMGTEGLKGVPLKEEARRAKTAAAMSFATDPEGAVSVFSSALSDLVGAIKGATRELASVQKGN